MLSTGREELADVVASVLLLNHRDRHVLIIARHYGVCSAPDTTETDGQNHRKAVTFVVP